MNRKETTIQDLLHLPIGRVASYSSFTLYSLLAEVNEQLGQAKSWLEGAMSIKYSTRIKQERYSSNKETGIVHIEDAGIKISHDIPKQVEWNQKKLSEIIENIAEMGSDPFEYIDISYKVSEHKFVAWPKSTQQIFLLARTVRAGNPSYKLNKIDKAGTSDKEVVK